jgi:hypothetical protein
MDLITRDARHRHRADLADIGVAGGRIEAIAPRIAGGPRSRSTPLDG